MSAPIFHVVELLPGIWINPAAVAAVYLDYGAHGECWDRVPVVRLITAGVFVIEDGRTLDDVLRLLGRFDFVAGR